MFKGKKIGRPRGTRDFMPKEMIKRRFVMEKIRKVFENYGFDEIETPAFEQWDVLTAKCGEEIREQIYKFEDRGGRLLGLRFDLTVPLARLVASNPAIPKPFKRYCISRVWRYEEPQSGRFREFWQADADVVGSSKMDADVEVLAVAADCLKALGFTNFTLRLSNRKVLDGFVRLAGIPESKAFGVFRAFDKLDKIGLDGVKKELLKRGISEESSEMLLEYVSLKGVNEIPEKARKLLGGIKIAEEGLSELDEILEKATDYAIAGKFIVDFSLVRGLDYYTGPIYEINVQAKKNVGSVAGGGRYDNLIALYGGAPSPATGISIGIERIVEIMEDEGMFNQPKTLVKLFISTVDESLHKDALAIARRTREAGISTEVDLMGRRLTKQLEYADSKGIPYVLIIGPEEIQKGKFRLKVMETREEREISVDELIQMLSCGK
ncbi:histidine--tRNA ligase [Candidatus Bathyarchaeota archaeon]|nr:histidine--tRNA ligase [Candidatus Bathyarchaeota archaeon]